MKQYAANTIAENMFSQVTNDGQTHLVLDMILDWKTDLGATSKDNMCIITRNGTKRMRRTIQGGKLQVSWKDRSKSWVPLKVMKDK